MRKPLLIVTLSLGLASAALAQQTPETPVNAVAKTQQPTAFESAVDTALPLTPEEIRAFRRQFASNTRAAATPLGKPPKPRTSSAVVSLQPGAEIPTVLVYAGLFSSLCFLDKSGQPWPIETYSGAGESDQVVHVTHPQPHVLDVSPKKPYTLANLSVTLQGLPTPVSLNLVLGGSDLHDARKDLHIDACGPLCKAGGGLPEPSLDQALYDLLDGIPPPGAHQRQVIGSNSTAVWEHRGLYYLRTQETLLSPACLPQHQARSSDGTRACIIPPIPLIAVTRNGHQAQMRVE